MKLLFDENISFRIVKRITEFFPDSIHISSIRPKISSDRLIFEYAKKHAYTIVTFDEDFQEIQSILGFPPKIVWLRMGNTSTTNVLQTLQRYFQEIKSMENDTDIGILEIH
jgi:predicted nuclease of predicted toxin-antitoxin system